MYSLGSNNNSSDNLFETTTKNDMIKSMRLKQAHEGCRLRRLYNILDSVLRSWSGLQRFKQYKKYFVKIEIFMKLNSIHFLAAFRAVF